MTPISKTGIFSKSEWTKLVDQLSLSPRQAEVVKHLLRGRSDKQIAGELNIGVPTIRTYLGRLLLRFGVQDRIELVLYIFQYFRKGCRQNGCPRHQRH